MAALLLKCYKPLHLLCPTSTTAIHVPIHKIFISNNKNFLTRNRFYCSTQLGQSQSCTSTNGTGGPENVMPIHQPLFLHNTMSKKKELLRPKTPGQVGIYLRHLGYKVKYVRNFTDVDDKDLRLCDEQLGYHTKVLLFGKMRPHITNKASTPKYPWFYWKQRLGRKKDTVRNISVENCGGHTIDQKTSCGDSICPKMA
ncbi:hypothetical protein RJ640_011615 [Escallonia rubra]|uniref:Uncharacterized protein n=1 Tax=Escallonia rubra TaxID=112253 RepID=A0AA88USA2_9ASTE|nr:hypothetical protein RJ640_011615 [Escallonia rubra]